MMKKLKRKLKSQAGESLAETLVALLIGALAIMMLAGAVSASSGVVLKSKDKLNDYYLANENPDGVVIMADGEGTTVPNGLTFSDSGHRISTQSYKITYYKNDEFSKTPVVAYKYIP